MKLNTYRTVGLVTLFCTASALCLNAQTPPVPSPGTPPVGHVRGGGEKHPEIRKAMRALNNAINDLQHADHDFAGHREKALDLAQQALKECQLALQADRK